MKPIAIAAAALLGAAIAHAKEPTMTVEYIRYEIPAAQHDAFVAAYESAGQELRASSHCLRYEVTQGVEQPDNFIVRIEWDSVSGHEQGFRTSPQFAGFFAKVKPFFPQIREMKHYAVRTQAHGAAPAAPR